ncbi:MAG: hypothetical protein HUU01_10720 [Saprospiraceae bacterium]|nr:hypothetical protein [Saprospiraceae bacterium]
MELDDMKKQLRDRLQSQGPEKSATELIRLFHKKTETAVSKILRNMLTEIAFGVVLVTGISIAAWFYASWAARMMALLLFLIMIVQVPAFYWQSRRLKNIAVTQGNLQETLSSLIFIVGEFIRLYLKYASWLIPFAAVLGGIVGFTIGKNEVDDPAMKPLDRFLDNYPFWGGITIIVFAALIIWGSYRYVRWAVWWSYGRYHQALKSYLNELEN